MKVVVMPALIGVGATMSSLYDADDCEPGSITIRRGTLIGVDESKTFDTVLIYQRPADGSFDIYGLLCVSFNGTYWQISKGMDPVRRVLVDALKKFIGDPCPLDPEIRIHPPSN